MRSRIVLGLLVLLTLAGSAGAASRSPASVVRTWISALNRGDNRTAASAFAPGARVVQGSVVIALRTRKEAVAWNAGLPCSARIASLSTKGDTVRATFVLGNRKTSTCNGDGAQVTVLIRVVKGKIVLWQEVTQAQGGSQPSGPAV